MAAGLGSLFGWGNYLLIQLVIMLVAGSAGIWLFYRLWDESGQRLISYRQLRESLEANSPGNTETGTPAT